MCRACWLAIVPITPPVCDRCGDPLPSWQTMPVSPGSEDPGLHSHCPHCRRQPGVVSRSRAIGAYDGTLRAVIHALKYEGRQGLAVPLGRLMARSGADILEGADVVVPVPLHRSRKRARGFNQAADIARHLGLPIAHALKKVRSTPSQTDLPAGKRHANVRQAFALAGDVSVRGKIVVLVDDVSTTGATLDACARVLLASGARDVRAITAARVVSQPR